MVDVHLQHETAVRLGLNGCLCSGPEQQEHCKSGPKHRVTQLCHEHQRGEGEKIHAGKAYPGLPCVSCAPGEVLLTPRSPPPARKQREASAILKRLSRGAAVRACPCWGRLSSVLRREGEMGWCFSQGNLGGKVRQG